VRIYIAYEKEENLVDSDKGCADFEQFLRNVLQ
jgi:hypothetical protein